MAPPTSEPDLERAIHRQWLAAHAGFREPIAIAVYTLALIAVASLGLIDVGQALLGPAPGPLIATLAANVAVIWAASLAYHRRGPETRLYRVLDHAETIALQAGALLLVALTPGARSMFWVVYLAHMTMLPAEPPRRVAIGALVCGGPLVVALSFLARGDTLAAVLCVVGALAGAINWRWSQSVKRRLALQTAARERLAEEVERLGVHETRVKTAQHLHDGLGADVATLSAEAERQAGRASPALTAELVALAERSRAMLEELRAAVWLVERPSRPWPDLVAHIEQSIRELLRGRARLELDVGPDAVGPGGALIPGDACLTLLRVLQEAARNSLTHGGAGRVRIRLEADRRWLRATLSDDGRGADGGSLVESGGLLNMRTRAEELGGRVAIQTHAGGTRVEVELPRSVRAVAA